MPDNEKIFLHADRLTEIKPLRLNFHKGDPALGPHDREIIRKWAGQIAKYNIPVFIHSFASAPTGIRDLTRDAARHEAIRLAFNRGLLAKNLLEQSGIDGKRLILTASAPDLTGLNDRITITTRRD